MKVKTLLLASLAILGISVVFSLFLGSVNSSPDNLSQGSLTACNSLYFNGDGKIDLLFFGKPSEVEEYADYLLSVEPFSDKKDDFNVYFIDDRDYSPDCGALYQGVAILCYSKDLIKKASSCPNDYIFVLKEESPRIRSTAYQQVASINTNSFDTVIVHEFGHVLASLSEEYVPANLQLFSENCKSSCDLFAGETNGCFEGCSKSNFFRSIENGVMRTLSSSDFGIYNKNLLLKALEKSKTSSITGNAISDQQSCEDQQYILLEGILESGSLDIQKKTLQKGCTGSNGNGPESYELISPDNQVVYEGNIQINYIFTDTQTPEDEQIDGEVFEADNQEIFFSLPIDSGADKINFLDDEGNLLGTTTLSDVGGRACEI